MPDPGQVATHGQGDTPVGQVERIAQMAEETTAIASRNAQDVTQLRDVASTLRDALNRFRR